MPELEVMIAGVLPESVGGAPPVGPKMQVRHFLTARIEIRSHTHCVVGRALAGSNSKIETLATASAPVAIRERREVQGDV